MHSMKVPDHKILPGIGGLIPCHQLYLYSETIGEGSFGGDPASRTIKIFRSSPTGVCSWTSVWKRLAMMERVKMGISRGTPVAAAMPMYFKSKPWKEIKRDSKKQMTTFKFVLNLFHHPLPLRGICLVVCDQNQSKAWVAVIDHFLSNCVLLQEILLQIERAEQRNVACHTQNICS